MPDIQRVVLLVEVGALRAREELVPGAEQRWPCGRRRSGSRGRGRPARAGRTSPSPRRTSSAEHHARAGPRPARRTTARWPPPAAARLPRCRAAAVGPLGRGRRTGHSLGADQDDVDAGRDLDLGVVYPGLPRVAPALDPEGPGALGRSSTTERPTSRSRAGWSDASRPAARRRRGRSSTTEALTASWPSRNTVARMGIDSPTVALAG